jgi:hypothetical protein
MVDINKFLSDEQAKSVKGARMSKYSGDNMRSSIEKMFARIKEIPHLTGTANGKPIYLSYKAIEKTAANGRPQYFITGFDRKNFIVEGVYENGKTFPAFFSKPLNEILSQNVYLDFDWTIQKHDILK